MLESVIRLLDGHFEVGEYSIAGNFDDGYTVWNTKDGEDSDTLYSSISFEKCVVWCLNSQEVIKNAQKEK